LESGVRDTREENHLRSTPPRRISS
jgi:hypothetical protein